jgi:hypothetical protein
LTAAAKHSKKKKDKKAERKQRGMSLSDKNN